MAPKPLWAQEVDADQLPAGWSLVATLRPASLKAVPQAVVQLGGGDWVVSQDFDGSSLVLTRFDPTGKRLASMKVASSDHGDRLEARGVDDELCGLYIGATWVELPWRSGHVWTRAEALKHRGTRALPTFGARAWCQGQIYKIDIGDVDFTVRYYGAPWKADGPSRNPQGVRNPAIRAHLEFYRLGDSKVAKHEDLGNLARDDKGNPIGGRLEAEGLAVGRLRNQRVLLVGFAVGGIGSTYMIVYARPLP